MTYGETTPTATTTSTGDNNIDALLYGRQWESPIVEFSFTSNFENDYEDEDDYPDADIHAASFESLNDIQREAAREWMQMYENVSGLTLVELRGFSDRDATIRMAESDNPDTAYAYYPWNGGRDSVFDGDIWFNRTLVLDDPTTEDSEYQPVYDNPVIGNYEYYTFGHEIGHALGLKHGHEEWGVRDVAMDSNRDSMEFSIMTYRSYIGDPLFGGYSNESWGYAQSLMMYDIKAIQQMYGANFDYNSGNTTYTFSTTTGEMSINGEPQGIPGGEDVEGIPADDNTDRTQKNRIFRTIWDGNGIDTYDFSNYTTNLSIDLSPGGWSDLDVGGNSQRANLGDGNYARGHVFNALQYDDDPRSLIENAEGGAGNDGIGGNAANNILSGNNGDDALFGHAGNDILNGDRGNDYLFGGENSDTLYGGDDDDELDGQNGRDVLYGGNGDDVLGGGNGRDRLYGEDGYDTLYGGQNDDQLWGGDGNDLLMGYTGSDDLRGGRGRDTLYGEDGIDFLYGEIGPDSLHGGNDTDLLYGGNGRDLLYGDDGDDFLRGDRGNDDLNGGNGRDWLEGYGGNGREQDILTGGAEFDTFVLGRDDSLYRGSFYLGSGYATITDFEMLTYEDQWGIITYLPLDTIQVFGSLSDYSLGYENRSGTSSKDTLIYRSDDLIGVVEDTTAIALSTDYFTLAS
ncbi:M10 family metallopeptidase C-terminal domain-containing protein [Leptothoe spongobia]|uniref:Protease n=1 Tax=Leptothoe spongobia TAU-MAC 1115 TaxID=1967444 RepID=A0A947DGF0_9CYAN|nr:hypothetical protein [Leptothoe spongobia]MBT9316460.1 protease [Leptothoe spongobia TAU-MAC 1115]